MNNLYTAIPNTIDEEQFEALLRGEQVRIERMENTTLWLCVFYKR